MSTNFSWAVSKGSYSDYGVLCICPDKKTAERIAHDVNAAESSYGEPAFVEQIPFLAESRMVQTYGLECEVWDNGTTSETRERNRVEHEADMLYPEHNRPVMKRWVRAPMYHNKGGRLEVFGTDRERVRRVFSDTRAQLVADPVLRKRREFKS